MNNVNFTLQKENADFELEKANEAIEKSNMIYQQIKVSFQDYMYVIIGC